jgi:putative membrane protein
MMFWFDHNVSGWGWFAMTLGMVAFWGLIITAVVMFVRAVGPASTTSAPPSSPEQILAERFARGEIDQDEYHRNLATLRGDAHHLTDH